MKFFLFTLLATSVFLGSLDARPADDVVEIEKQRLIKFPDDDFRYDGENTKQNPIDSEAERIMQEIEKINLALGYVKKQKPERRRYPPIILDSSQYLYPQSSFFPFRSLIPNGVQQSPATIRSLLEFPSNERATAAAAAAAHYAIPVEVNDDDSHRIRSSPNDLKTTGNGYKIVGDLEDFKRNQNQKSELNLDPRFRLFFVPQQELLPPFRRYIDPRSQELKLRNEKVAPHRTASTSPATVVTSSIAPASTASAPSASEVKKRMKPQKENRIRPTPAAVAATAQRHVIGDPTSTSQLRPLQNAISSFFNRQQQQKTPTINQKQQQQQQQQQQQPPSPITADDDYNWDDSSSTSDDDNEEHSQEKNVFGFKDKMQAGSGAGGRGVGGVIIKRLRVRKGGIAIAGPGGVATAGSGGTAIVGPGGYALTHPRSLTIAGPGAKVIAIPETTDLQEALGRTTNNDGAESFPREGKLVATGPTIYYSPDPTFFG